jgi:hypothetical protein
MEFHAGHRDGSRTVHLTARLCLLEALCGETVALDGEPDGAVICEACHALAVEQGGDPESWVVFETTTVALRAAA